MNNQDPDAGTEFCMHLDEDSWWVRDYQRIELAKVCRLCEAAKLSHYRPEVLQGYGQEDVDEPIEPEAIPQYHHA